MPIPEDHAADDTGIRTSALVYTDVVDSTRVGETIGPVALHRLWEAHDRETRRLARQRGGLEIGRSDGFLLLFDDVAQALAFTHDYHAALAALQPPLKARVGLHWGPIRLRANDDDATALGANRFELDGTALPVVARVMAAALGGQTLLTEDARAALALGSEALVAHGHWRLKGLERPLALYEVRHALAPLEPPPDGDKAVRVVRQGDLWLPRRDIPHNLPAERDAFFGRADVLHALAARFAEGARLVSLTGIGGAGKTRVALRYARAWLGDYAGGAVFCDLAAARDRDGLLRAVARGLDMPLGAGDTGEQLARAIAARGRVLVLLDNVEHLVAHVPSTLGPWLDRAPEAAFLATTRAVLGLPGERVVSVEALPVDDGVRLFEQRAESSAWSFQVGDGERAAMASLVRLLDGLPLAIELAAARARLAPPSVLLARMSDRFRLLAVGGGRSDRQATLRGTFDWSWDLLDGAAKAVLAQLSVFDGGFTLAAAEAVLDLPAGAEAWPLDLVQTLVDQSLVRLRPDGRLDLLQSVQQYAAEHLATPGRYAGSGPAALAVAQARHGAWFAALDERSAIAGGGIELPNLVAACRRAVARADAATAVGALRAAWDAIRLTGPFGMGLDLAEAVGALPGLARAERMVVDGVAGTALSRLGRADEALRRLEAAIDAARAEHRAGAEALWLCVVADTSLAAGALARAHAALAEAQALVGADDALGARLHNSVGSLAVAEGRLEDARQAFEAALACARRAGSRQWEGGLLTNLAAIAWGEGRADEAEALLAQSLELTSNLGDRNWQGSAHCNLAALLVERGRLAEAREHLGHALRIARALGRAALEYTALCNLGLVAEGEGQADEARQHLQAAVAAAQAHGDARCEGQFRGYLGRVYAQLGLDEPARACLHEGEQRLRAGADPLSLGLLLACAAESFARLGDAPAAAAALAEARALQHQAGADDGSELGRAIARAAAVPVSRC